MKTETFPPQLIPLTRWEDGSIRVGNTRILLDLVVYAFNEGRTPEEIVLNYPTLKLSEVYGAITHYLENRDQIDAYIAQREDEAEQLWTKIESDPQQKQLRQKLLARRAEQSQIGK
jgi:uncharacterized protein (DUF433 family)